MDMRKHHRRKRGLQTSYPPRLSIGLEDWYDIIRDLELAREKV